MCVFMPTISCVRGVNQEAAAWQPFSATRLFSHKRAARSSVVLTRKITTDSHSLLAPQTPITYKIVSNRVEANVEQHGCCIITLSLLQ